MVALRDGHNLRTPKSHRRAAQHEWKSVFPCGSIREPYWAPLYRQAASQGQAASEAWCELCMATLRCVTGVYGPKQLSGDQTSCILVPRDSYDASSTISWPETAVVALVRKACLLDPCGPCHATTCLSSVFRSAQPSREFQPMSGGFGGFGSVPVTLG